MPRAKKKPVASSKLPSAPIHNMSNHPVPPAPPYWGSSNYTQQWTQRPSSGTLPYNAHPNPDPSAPSQQYHNFESFYANAHLPGLGGVGATGTFPPPPFAFPGTFPPAVGAPQFANLAYPAMPLAPAPPQLHLPQNQASTNDFTHSTHSNTPGLQHMTTTNSRPDLDREEGELTDIEAPATTEQQSYSQPDARHSKSNIPSAQRPAMAANGGDKQAQMEHIQAPISNGIHDGIRHSGLVHTNRRESLSSELEEGEASPESRSSSRDSGSPYNPPMPANARSPSMPKSVPQALHPDKATGAVDLQLSASTDLQASPGSALSLAQLRVQAQGALLSLVPHSIRYSELVGEGINPTVLKQLYEEVGIKVPSTPPADLDVRANTSEDVLAGANPSANLGESHRSTKQPEPQTQVAQKPPSIEPSPTPPQSTQANPAKPMERKEVIARMLAAKAAKKSPAAAQSQQDAAQLALPSQTVAATIERSSASSPSRDSSANEKELRVKEKNRAQTELARQRIEQLKKQGLMRNLQKLQPDSHVSDKEQGVSVQDSTQPQISAAIQHPLPERPPLPESASHDQIPGLFMTGQAPAGTNGTHVTPLQDATLEAVSQPRSAQRKRPRASDFDDDPIPIPVPKKTFSNGTNHLPSERLVIDISDDEFYGDGDEDVDMHVGTTSADLSKSAGALTAEESARAYQPPIESLLPHRPATSQSFGLSTSSTPNNLRNSEQEDLRKKDLEIQAMHRRIAELEQRKKAKLASRTQSPHASDSSPPEPAVPVSVPPINNGKNIEELLAPMEADDLRKMKAKILRMQEIEAGVPSLGAEIQKAETKLVEAKKEEERLASELAKGKEGLRQLMQELDTIKLEVSGLSLDHVNAALTNMEAKKNLPVEVVQGMLRRLSIPELQHSNITTYNHYAIAPGYENEAPDEGIPAAQLVPEADVRAQQDPSHSEHAIATASTAPTAENQSIAPIAAEASVPDAAAEEPSDTSMSEDSSSPMDESSDDSSSDSDSSDEEIPDAQNSGTNPVAPLNEVEATNASLPKGPEGHELETHPHESQPSDALVRDDIMLDAGGEIQAQESENRASRESSVSEAYEPPEPEESASGSESSYSPAPSPDFHSPATNMDVSGSSEDQPLEAGEPLTAKVQELEPQQSSQYYYDIGPLDVR
ncbi:uncharacterized protein BDV17DRAFT_179168 [Aspergillus undulatus]|uniref:uncharacterized protein n=1 Tax=Aspergillus undulatus TaxID=1810928 RepID=UPI003CCCD5C5